MGAGKAADLTYWEGAARMIASVSKTSKIVVEKSTVPVKTAEAIEKVCICLVIYSQAAHACASQDLVCKFLPSCQRIATCVERLINQARS